MASKVLVLLNEHPEFTEVSAVLSEQSGVFFLFEELLEDIALINTTLNGIKWRETA